MLSVPRYISCWPLLRISGAIFVEDFTVQTLTSCIYLGRNLFEMEQIKYVAKVF